MGKMFDGGLPTSPDVDKLIEKYGVPGDGFTVEYDELAELIEAPVGSNRFRGVIARWRRRLERDHNVLLEAMWGSHYQYAGPKRRVDICGSQFKAGARKVEKAGVRAQRTEKAELNQDEIRTLDHVALNAAAFRAARLSMPKQLVLPDPEPGNQKFNRPQK
jgi:hypothetical protein